MILPWRVPIAEIGYEGKDKVRNPCGQHGGRAGIDGKGRGDGLEHDVAEAQAQADTQIEAHSSLSLSRRERESDDGEDEGGEGHGDALVELHLVLHDIARAAARLLGDVVEELGRGEGLLLALGIDQVGGFHEDDRVLDVAGDDPLAQADQRARLPVGGLPVVLRVGDRVVLDLHGRHVADQLLAFKLVEGEAVAALVAVVVVLDVGHRALAHLQLDVLRRSVLLGVAVERLEVLADDRAVGDDEAVEVEGDAGDEHARDHVGAHQPPEGDARGEHRDDLGVAGQLRGEEDDGNEHEERGEEVGVVGDEVGVVVEDDGTPGRMVLRKLREVLVEVEDQGDGDDQHDGEYVGADKLPDDVPVETTEKVLGRQLAQHTRHPGPRPAYRLGLGHPAPHLVYGLSHLHVEKFVFRVCPANVKEPGLYPPPELIDDGRLPLGEVALEDVGPGVGDEPQVEGEVVDAGYLHRQQLARLEEVVEVGLGGDAVDLAARGVEGREVGLPLLVAHVHRALVGEEHGVAAVARGHHAVEHIDTAGDALQQVLGRAHTHEVARLVLGQDGVDDLDHLVHHLGGLAHGQSANGIALGALVGDVLSRLAPQVGIGAALDDRKEGLGVAVEGLGLAETLEAAVEPALGKPKAVLGVGVVALARRTLVERHDDVGTDDALDVHHALGGEDVLRTVDVGSKLAALLRELADAREGEDLEAAGVGEDRAVPTVEAMEATSGPEHLAAGAEVEVVGVAQDDLGLHLLLEFAEVDSLHAAHRAHGHEDGGEDLAMGRLNAAGPRVAVGVGVLQFERHWPFSSF